MWAVVGNGCFFGEVLPCLSTCPMHVQCMSNACPMHVHCMSNACPMHVQCVQCMLERIGLSRMQCISTCPNCLMHGSCSLSLLGGVLLRMDDQACSSHKSHMPTCMSQFIDAHRARNRPRACDVHAICHMHATYYSVPAAHMQHACNVITQRQLWCLSAVSNRTVRSDGVWGIVLAMGCGRLGYVPVAGWHRPSHKARRFATAHSIGRPTLSFSLLPCPCPHGQPMGSSLCARWTWPTDGV